MCRSLPRHRQHLGMARRVKLPACDGTDRRPVKSPGVIRPAASVLLVAEVLSVLVNRPPSEPMPGRAR